MHRFFVAPGDVHRTEQGTPEFVQITGEEAWHLAKVLRLALGDEVVVGDNTGMEYRLVLTSVTPNSAQGRVVAAAPSTAEIGLPLTLFQGLPKADKMDYIVQKCTEMGIATIRPVETERSVLKLAGAKATERVARWQRISKEAAKQAGRAVCPQVAPVSALADAVRAAGLPFLLAPWEEATGSFSAALQAIPGAAKSGGIGVVIGPEGGLSRAEADMLSAMGGVLVSLGPRILRTETAGLVTLSALLFAMGELGG